ncbi:MAG: hypothetical protein ACI9TH_003716 [Kiritimatiellia bacterium]|jgi:hypothetical protein
MMLKLYKGTGAEMHYCEAWIEGQVIIEHKGRIGTRGKTLEHKRLAKKSDDENIRRILEPLVNGGGYEPIADENHAVLLIEYAIEGVGTKADLEKRHQLADRMNETLGWTGLGHCDGGSIGDGTMEACCYVVDFEVARKVIEEDLNDTPFADYTRIYDEGADEEEGEAAPA